MATKVICDQCNTVLGDDPMFRLERMHRTADLCSLACLQDRVRELDREAAAWMAETVHR